ncbi:MAG: hypothetical protein RLZZ129_255 [Verrucomicrobiota bacterium]|jgi:cell division protein FtsI (penicillin-binding protein 3)/stage V sporulation protein D (sporulation-specific penicillin-binding protein)
MSKGFASNFRLYLIAFLILGCLSGVGVRLVFLHIIDRADLLSHIEKTRRQIIVDNARRGDILDANGHLLATSRTLIVLGVDPQSLRPEDESKWPQLAELIGMPWSELHRVMTTKTRGTPANPVPPAAVGLAFNVTPGNPGETTDDAALDEAPETGGQRLIRWARLSEGVEESVYDQIQALGIRGVYGNRTFRRTYPNNALAAHLIGYVNKAGEPASGVEAYADFYLRGQNGWREGERDGRRRELAQFRTREVRPVDGYHVSLTIDTVIQHMVEEELQRIAQQFRPAKATIIVSDARTGFILGLGNYPTFNLNQFNTAPLEVQRNIAITDQLDPGSTFKIVPAAGALNDGLVTPSTRFDCMLATIEYKGRTRRFIPDDHRYDHLLPVSEIISRSSNIGAAQLGMKLGEERLYHYARAFGFGERSGFPFGGEIPGMLNAPDRWTVPDITRIPAGYSISATPLQIHYAMGTIASGGELLQPQIIREIRDASNESVYRFDRIAKRRVVSEQTARSVARMLQGVMRRGEGTAPDAAIPNYEVAGKTGTAQKLINGAYSKTNHIGSFSGFFPASRPELVITVIVDDGRVPGKPAYGSIVAAPSFKRLAEQLIQHLDIKPVDYTAGARLVAMEGGRR